MSRTIKAQTLVKAVSDLYSLIESSLQDDKAENIVSVDLSGKTEIADRMIIASGRSDRHVTAIARHLISKIREAGIQYLKTEGVNEGKWVVVDAGDVVVHIFKPEIREYYNLEKMWTVPVTEPA